MLDHQVSFSRVPGELKNSKHRVEFHSKLCFLCFCMDHLLSNFCLQDKTDINMMSSNFVCFLFFFIYLLGYSASEGRRQTRENLKQSEGDIDKWIGENSDFH